MNKNSIGLTEKIMGCLLGGAIGNAFGSPFEGMEYYEIEEKFGKVKNFLDPACLITQDDCHVTLITCKTYLEKQGRINSFDLANKWIQLLKKENVWYDCYNSYELLRKGYSPQLTGILNWDTGSALMAIAPVGIYNACDPDNAYIDAIEIGELYQRGVDVEVAALFAAGIAEAFKDGSSYESVVDLILKKAPNKNIKTYGYLKEVNIKKSLEQILEITSKHDDIFNAREEIYNYCLSGWHNMDPLEFFVLSVAVFYSTKGNTELSIIAGANMGRDADSIPSLSGALSGALNGVNSIPKRFLKPVNNKIYNNYKKISKSFSDLLRKNLKKDKENIKHFKKSLINNLGNKINDKIFGAIIGGVIGANIGVNYEGFADIRKYNGSYTDKIKELKTVKDIKEIDISDNFNFILDDGLADIVYEKLLEKKGRISYRDLENKWVDYLDTNKFKHSINKNYRSPAFFDIRNSLELIKKGVPGKLIGAVSPLTSSAFSISIPIGIFNIKDPNQAFYETFELSSILQRNEGRYLPSLIAYIIASLDGNNNKFSSSVEKLIRNIDRILPENNICLDFDVKKIKSIIKNILNISKKYDNFIDARPEIFSDGIKRSFGNFVDDPLEVFLLIISILEISKCEFRDSIISSINTFRDTTTIGFICGAVSGFVNGVGSIPAEWISMIPSFRYKKAEEISKGMVDLIKTEIGFKNRVIEDFKKYF